MKTSSDILTTRYGGVIPIIREMIKRGMPELIDSTFQETHPRKCNSKYKLSDMFLSWIASSLCGAKRIDNVTDLSKDLSVIPGLNFPSHDTIGRLMKDLACDVQTQTRKALTKEPNDNFYDDNLPLNKLLIEATKLMGALNTQQEYILDVDCTFIPTRCIGAKSMKGKDQPGFNPMICLIGSLPVFISMRNGNSISDFRISETIEQCLDLLDAAGIKVSKVRTDGCGYRRDLISMLCKRGVEFVTASPVNKHFTTMLEKLEKTQWSNVTIETANAIKACQIGETAYVTSVVKTKIRIIALKVPTDAKLKTILDPSEFKHLKRNKAKMARLQKQEKLKVKNKRYVSTDWNEVKGFNYKIIATNDFTSSAEELIYLYNDRGTSERNFDTLKNDFGFALPPYQWMNYNTVFLILTALANNVFRAVAQLFNEHIDDVELNARVRRFQKAFIDAVAICVNGEWTYYNTKIDFGKIA